MNNNYKNLFTERLFKCERCGISIVNNNKTSCYFCSSNYCEQCLRKDIDLWSNKDVYILTKCNFCRLSNKIYFECRRCHNGYCNKCVISLLNKIS